MAAATSNPTQSRTKRVFSIPWAAVNWLVISALIFFIGSRVVTLRDQQRFPNDFELVVQPTEIGNTVRLDIVAGTFRFGGKPEVSTPVEAGTFTPGTDNPVASKLFESIPDATEITIKSQTITIAYHNDSDADLMLRRTRRPVINAVINDAATISGSVASGAENTLVFTTTDAEWHYGRYVPSMIPEGQQEVYLTRQAGENGSDLAQFLFAHVSSMEELTINPDSLVLTYRDGAVENQVVKRVQGTLNDFYPRASLQPDLWIFTIAGSSETLLSIAPLDTGVPLVVFTLLFGMIELLFSVYFRDRDDHLLLPLVRSRDHLPAVLVDLRTRSPLGLRARLDLSHQQPAYAP